MTRAGLGRYAAALLVLATISGCATTVPPASPSASATPAAVPAGSTAPSATSVAVASTAAPPTEPASASSGRLPAAVLAPSGPTEQARVGRVVDGDTIVVDRGRGNERLRYIGIDTPETVKPGSPVEWMGEQASKANVALVEGRTVVLEKDFSEVDRYGRLLRHVWLHEGGAWRLVNRELVRQGFARVSTYPPDVKYVDLYLAAQVDARQHDRGLWGDGPIDFLAPADGATVSTSTILVRGRAPAGSRVVRDIPNAPDQSARAAADGTWSMKVGLKRGINSLRFRVGDEKATTRILQVVYAP